MNVTFLIGNGFDLNVGLNTRFSDFLRYYLRVKNEDHRLIRFKNDISKDFDAWSDAEMMLGIYTGEYKGTEVDDYLFCLSDFRINLSTYLKTELSRINYKTNNDEIVSVFSSSILKFYSELPLERRNTIRAVFSSRESEDWNYSFITFNYTNVLSNCIKAINDSTKPLSTHRYGSATKNEAIGKLIHIHGAVNKNMIMGVDNEDQIVNSEFKDNKKFRKRFIKPTTNEELRTLRDRDAFDLINDSEIVCIFGMSLGETDTTWWNIISSWIQSKSYNQLIVFVREEEWNEVDPGNVFANEESVWERFYSLTDFPEDKRDHFEGRIHVVVNSNLFKVNLTSQEESLENNTIKQEKPQ